MYSHYRYQYEKFYYFLKHYATIYLMYASKLRAAGIEQLAGMPINTYLARFNISVFPPKLPHKMLDTIELLKT